MHAQLNIKNVSADESTRLIDACLALIAGIRVHVPFVRSCTIDEGPRWIGGWRTLHLKVHVGWWRAFLYREDITMIVHRLCHEHQPGQTRIKIEVCR